MGYYDSFYSVGFVLFTDYHQVELDLNEDVGESINWDLFNDVTYKAEKFIENSILDELGHRNAVEEWHDDDSYNFSVWIRKDSPQEFKPIYTDLDDVEEFNAANNDLIGGLNVDRFSRDDYDWSAFYESFGDEERAYIDAFLDESSLQCLFPNELAEELERNYINN